MAELLGGAILSAGINTLLDRLASRDVLDFFRRHELDEGQLNELKVTLRTVTKVVNDADEKQTTDSQVKEWLDDLKDAIYEAEDFLDEIAYEALRWEIEDGPQPNEEQVQTKGCKYQVRNFFSSINPCKKGISTGEKEPKLKKILETLGRLERQTGLLGLEKSDQENALSNKLPTTSLVDDSNVCGRDGDKVDIVKLLRTDDGNAKRLGVILIVGMGGVGKTTLAQIVYNDSQVKGWFDLKAWVSVPKVLDVFNVTKDILKGFGSQISDSLTADQLHCELERTVTGNKVLVVLDDVWNVYQEKWESLMKPFKSAKQGSKIIVTTRDASIAPVMPTITVATHFPQVLSKDDSWSLFEKHAFDDCSSSEHPDLVKIGIKIVEKCGGLPLAVKTLGGVLRSKRQIKQWKNVLTNNLWDLQNDTIIPALRLSYHYLPSKLKRCFSYCAILPKNYRFTREELVLLWMAEGFLVQPKGDEEMEEIGEEYFNDLVSRSFFQQSSVDPFSYLMHDLINDLATLVSGEFCFRLESGNLLRTTKRARHLSYDDGAENLKRIHQHPHLLRTFVFLSRIRPYDNDALRDFVSALTNVRVLILTFHSTMVTVPDSIGSLKHLRYLDLTGNQKIRCLPESVCHLYNLQVVKLCTCSKLVRLPTNMGRLINLRHLDIGWTVLKEMPLHMGELSKLRKLSDFYVGEKSGCRLKELGKLQKLGGILRIWNLENVVDEGEASEANLKGKEHLRELELRWNEGKSDGENPLHERVLEKLEPHVDLKSFTIRGYGGTTFPNWPFSALERLRLSASPNLREAPTNHPLPSLKSIEIVGCPQLEIECFPLDFFPKSEELHIEGCPKLLSFNKGRSLAQNLTSLDLWDCSNLKILPECMPSLVSLWLWRCPEIELSPVEGLSLSCKLQRLDISECNKLIASRNEWNLQMLPSLSKFEIGGRCEDVESFPEKTLLPSTLTHLSISNLQNLKSLDYDGLRHLTSLRELEISGCPMLQSIPEEGLPSSLSHLNIFECPLLEERCKREEGEDWPKISHIPKITNVSNIERLVLNILSTS